jgi:hypothetical protein
VQTDNSHLKEKLALRESCIVTGKERVLDCFAGKGLLWSQLKAKHPGLKVNAIEKERGKNKAAFWGDNLKILGSLKLENYDIIDLDAYGVPQKQLEIISDSNFKGKVVITAIFSVMGRLPDSLLIRLGYTKKMINKAPTLICRHGKQKFLNYLACIGYNTFKFYFLENSKLYGVATKTP